MQCDHSHCMMCLGGRRWIRTIEVTDNRFTVCPLWPLGNPPIFSCAAKQDAFKKEVGWSWWTDLNPRPADYKSAALPTELHQQICISLIATGFSLTQICRVVNRGFERIWDKDSFESVITNSNYEITWKYCRTVLTYSSESSNAPLSSTLPDKGRLPAACVFSFETKSAACLRNS